MIQFRLKHINRCSASVWSATGLKVTVGAPHFFFPSHLVDLGQTGQYLGSLCTDDEIFSGSTWATGRRGLANYLALGDLGFGPWSTLFSLPLAISALQMAPFIFRGSHTVRYVSYLRNCLLKRPLCFQYCRVCFSC